MPNPQKPPERPPPWPMSPSKGIIALARRHCQLRTAYPRKPCLHIPFVVFIIINAGTVLAVKSQLPATYLCAHFLILLCRFKISFLQTWHYSSTPLFQGYMPLRCAAEPQHHLGVPIHFPSRAALAESPLPLSPRFFTLRAVFTFSASLYPHAGQV